MRIVRTDLVSGEKTLIAGYEYLGLQMGMCMLLIHAKEQVKALGVRHLEIEKNDNYRITLVDYIHKPVADLILECPQPATYWSIFDGGAVTCTSDCNYYAYNKEVTDIQPGDNGDEAAGTNARTDEYVTLADGTILRAEDGVTFNY